MDREKRVKTHFHGCEGGEIPSSFSSITSCWFSVLSQGQGQAQTEAEAKAGQGSDVKNAHVNDLPPEMLTEVLKSVDTHRLFECRLVNRQWNEISTGILWKRSDAKISFHFQNKNFYQKRANTNKHKTSLKSFLACIKKSTNWPFVRFAFVCNEERGAYYGWNSVSHEYWKAVLSAVDEYNKIKNQNPNPNQISKIKSLEFRFENEEMEFQVLTEKLRDLLLLNKIPELEELGLDFSNNDNEEEEPKIKLFSPTDENTAVQLPHLKTIHLNQNTVFQLPGILKDLLNSAVNLKKIYLYENHYMNSVQIYDFLQPLGKFHLLKTFESHVDHKFLLQVKERPDFTRALFKLELEELELELNYGNDSDSDFDSDADSDSELEEDPNIAHATNFISCLFESSQNSLEKLRMSPLWFLRHLQFPRFKRLNNLKLKKPDGRRDIFFPPGVRSQDIFPAVRKLDLPKCDWCRAFPHLDSIPILPSVQNLSVSDIRFTQDCICVLDLLCPNLGHLKIHRQTNSKPQVDFLPIGRQIWTGLKQLESLEVDIDVDSHENSSAALDSCFTGIAPEDCQRLWEIMEAKKTLEKWGSGGWIPPSELTAERKHPSIFNMTNLKTLKINPYAGKKLLRRQDFFTENLTWISEEYAFKFLPHLKPNPKPTQTE